MQLSQQSPEYQALFRQAEQAECTCKGRSEDLQDTAGNGCTKCCTKFIDQVGRRDDYGTTALIKSIENDHPEVAKLLIPLEATMQRYDGYTALMSSAANGHLEVVKLLIPHEAKMQDEYGWTALMESALNGHLEVAELLIPLEATMQNNDGTTALMESIEKGHLEVAKLLVEHEAGIKTTNGRTATTIAISEYQLSCLRLLLANDAEREASQIPRVMLAAYDGDIRYLLANQGDWGTTHEKMAVLDFALLGSQRKAIRLLVSSKEVRQSFAEQVGSRFGGWNSIVLARCFLSAHASFVLDIAPAVHMMRGISKSWLLVAALGEQMGNVAPILRAVCTPDAESMLRILDIFCNEPQVTRVLAGLKHVGFSYFGETVESLAKKEDGPVQKYLASNPLKQAQIKRVEKEAERKLPSEKQACWREVEAESAFNSFLVTASRGAIRSASRLPRRIPGHNSNRIRQKQNVNDYLLLGAFRFMWQVVQEMLDE